MSKHAPWAKAFDKVVTPFEEFIHHESTSGLLLMACAILALVFANTAFHTTYEHILHTQIGFSFGEWRLEHTLHHWINDGLMWLFFFLVGLEIKREVLEGELSSVSQIALPAVAAIGGMIVPAAIYLAINGGDPALVRGWAIPTATDIAFALGILMLLGKRVPLALKVFLTTVAVFDDLGAIVIIALFYTDGLSMTALALGLAGLGVCWAFNRSGVARTGPYILIGILVWTCFLKSGVHATLAGVALGLTIPLNHRRSKTGPSPLRALEHALHPWVAFLVLPTFAFANAGVSFNALSFNAASAGLPAGIALGLIVGKQIGVFGASWLMIRTGLARMPTATNYPMLYGVSVLCGIGFTMSLFIGGLAFDDAALSAGVRLGVLSGSLVSGFVGYFILKRLLAAAGEHTDTARTHARRRSRIRIGEARKETS
jgi:NhaA family Na+:H+ antiporter